MLPLGKVGMRFRRRHRHDRWRLPAPRQAKKMAGIAVIGCVMFAVFAVTDGNFDWHRYTSIVGFIVLAWLGSWAVSALSAIAFQTRRRLAHGRNAGRRNRPWDWRTGDKVVRLPERGAGDAAGRVLPSLRTLAGAIAIGAMGSFFVFSLQSGLARPGPAVRLRASEGTSGRQHPKQPSGRLAAADTHFAAQSFSAHASSTAIRFATAGPRFGSRTSTRQRSPNLNARPRQH